MDDAPRIETFILGMYETNCFVVSTPASPACWIVDCGFEPDALLDFVARRSLVPERLLLTHAHVDHIAGVEAARARFPGLEVWVHEAEVGFCEDPRLNLSIGLGEPLVVGEPEHRLADSDTLDLAGTTWRVVHAPGHSPGGVLFVHDPSRQAIVGDTLFAGSIGRMDFPTSDPGVFRRTLDEVLLALPDEMTIHPGHGPATTIGRERRTNPFLLEGRDGG